MPRPHTPSPPLGMRPSTHSVQRNLLTRVGVWRVRSVGLLREGVRCAKVHTESRARRVLAIRVFLGTRPPPYLSVPLRHAYFHHPRRVAVARCHVLYVHPPGGGPPHPGHEAVILRSRPSRGHQCGCQAAPLALAQTTASQQMTPLTDETSVPKAVPGAPPGPAPTTPPPASYRPPCAPWSRRGHVISGAITEVIATPTKESGETNSTQAPIRESGSPC